MPTSSASRCVATSLLLASGLLTATACTSWQAQTGTVQQALAPSPTASVDSVRVVRITTPTGKIELSNPQVVNDTLYGHDPKRGYAALPVGQIQLVESKHANPLGTTIVVVGLAAGVAATVIAIHGMSELCHDYEC